MTVRKQSRGICAHCGLEIVKSSVGKHLASCAPLREAMQKADAKGKPEAIYHLRAQALGLTEFWLNLEMRGAATLEQLDRYLRAIWLECCGHMSEFSLGKGWSHKTLPMSRRIEKVFDHGVEVTHVYDFGTSSETLIKAVGVREGRALTRHPVALLVRNVMPPSECIECGKPAAWLCHQCLIEEDRWGALCDEHVRSHPHQDYGDPVPLVNSPRMGMCGYTGPAAPPY